MTIRTEAWNGNQHCLDFDLVESLLGERWSKRTDHSKAGEAALREEIAASQLEARRVRDAYLEEAGLEAYEHWGERDFVLDVVSLGEGNSAHDDLTLEFSAVGGPNEE